MTDAHPSSLCLGIAREGPSGFEEELSQAVEATADELGWDHRRVGSAADEARVDLVLAIGNARIYPDLVRRRASAPRILWHLETLPVDLTRGVEGGLHRALPTGRLLDAFGGALPRFARSATFARWREVAARERETSGNLRDLRRAAPAFSAIAIDSLDRARGARATGIAVQVIPLGYHPSFCGPLGGPPRQRDIPVLMLGHLPGVHGRRQHLLPIVEKALAAHDIDVVRVTPWLAGAERRELLERTRIVLDVHRVPGNHPGFRYLVATAAGAALASEPLSDPWPLVPGTHVREAPVERLADEVRALLADEPARRRLVEAGQDLLAGELHLRRILPRLVGLVRPVATATIDRR